MKHNRLLSIIILIISSFSSFCYASTIMPRTIIKDSSDSLRTDSMKIHKLKEATVVGTRLLFVIKNDTAIYDLDALSLKNSALLKDAFEKLPGMSFRKGLLYYNGREVKRVLINGMDFSDKNPLLALQALPSYIMKNVKVYDKKSDFFIRSGIDDGKQELIADVSVRRKYMGVWTGDFSIGGGTNKRFSGKGFANTFKDQYRISLFGNADNINEQIWYNGDGKERASDAQIGDNRFYTPGTTFFWKNKKSQKDIGYFKIDGGLDYNKELYNKKEWKNSESYLSDGSMYSAVNFDEKTNTDRYAGHVKINWNITKFMFLDYLGSFDLYKSKNHSTMLKANWNENPIYNGESLSETLKKLQYDDSLQTNATDFQQKEKKIDRNGTNYSNLLTLNCAIVKNTYLNFKYKFNIRNNEDEEYNKTYYKYFNEDVDQPQYINRLLNKTGTTKAQSITTTINQYFDIDWFKRFNLFVEYTYDWTQSSSNEKGYLINQQNESNLVIFQSEMIDNETTRNWNEKNNIHAIKMGLYMLKGIFSLTLRPCFNFHHEELDYTKKGLPAIYPQKNYSYLSSQFSSKIRFAKAGTILTDYYISPNIPNIGFAKLLLIDYQSVI